MKLDSHLDTCADYHCEAALLAGVPADTNLGFFWCSSTDPSLTFAGTCPMRTVASFMSAASHFVLSKAAGQVNFFAQP